MTWETKYATSPGICRKENELSDLHERWQTVPCGAVFMLIPESRLEADENVLLAFDGKTLTLCKDAQSILQRIVVEETAIGMTGWVGVMCELLARCGIVVLSYN